MPRELTILMLLVSTWHVACAHEVVRLSGEPPAAPPLAAPIPLTVAMREGSFARSRVNGDGVTELFARELREARIFQGVMHPVPPGADPRWEIELAGSDSVMEPGSNFWKGAIATMLPPLAFFISFQNDYTLELEALLLDDREIVASYFGKASIRHRYQSYASRVEMELEALEVVVAEATRRILASIARDEATLRKLNQRVR